MKTNAEMSERLSNLSLDKKYALMLILDELDKAEKKYPDPWAINKLTNRYDLLYAANVVNEEAGELVKEAMSHEHEGKIKFFEMIEECAQTGCTTIRFLVNTLNHWKSLSDHQKYVNRNIDENDLFI